MLKSTLSYKARWEFWNLWYIMIIINDILIIWGSGIKERIERKVISIKFEIITLICIKCTMNTVIVILNF